MENIVSDSYFQIGEQHIRSGLPCEDYALDGNKDTFNYIIVSDGCSSGGKTDLGARLVSHILARTLESELWQLQKGNQGFVTSVLLQSELLMQASKGLLSLSHSDLLATSLFAYVSSQTGLIKILGDGVVARVYKNGEKVLSSYEWENNTPFYLAYKNNAMQDFVHAHGGDLDAYRLTEHRVRIHEGMQEEEKKHFTLDQGITGIDIPLEENELKNLTHIGLFSDGVTQIEGVQWTEAVLQFLNYPSSTGSFLKRRMIRQLKDYTKNDSRPMDDISGAVMTVQQNQR